MKKIVTVYTLTANETSVNFPTKAQATTALKHVELFGLTAEITVSKKEVEI